MKERYNIALILDNDIANQYLIGIAKECLSLNNLPTNYCLGDKSIPHISLFQFEVSLDDTVCASTHISAEAKLAVINHQIALTWNNFKSSIRGSPCCHILDKKLNVRTDQTEIFKDTSWIEIPILFHTNQIIFTLHKHIFKIMNQLGYDCLNAKLENFKPHITLINYINKIYTIKKIPTIANDIFPIFRKIPIQLSIGKANNNWELTELTKVFT